MGAGYSLVDTYDHTNYLSKFDFYAGPDPGNGGFVNYLSQSAALQTGLASTVATSHGTDIRLGVDSANATSDGRNSFRLQSASTYQYGLFVGYFTHFPQPTCGAWPAFWMYSFTNFGEFDIYENWNTEKNNRITFHTSSEYPSCGLSSTPVDSNDPITATNCYSDVNVGCGVTEEDGYWGSSTGGTYALEWTTYSISVWSFAPGSEPSDLLAHAPEPSNWPTPHIKMTPSTCSDLTDAFGPMNILMNIDFCGNPVASDSIWGESCAASTGTSCNSYVGNHPSDFKNVYFQMNRLEIYQT
jgi:hypothetical protein